MIDKLHLTSGFARWRHYLAWTYFYIFAAVARVEKVSLPPPREAADTLPVSGGQRSGEFSVDFNLT
jgi:hypothetical protein